MFRLSSFQASLLDHYKASDRVIVPDNHLSDIIDSLSSAPLEDLSVSRPQSRLSWGIPVPNDPGHTIYVWFDALTVYLAGLGYPWPQYDINFAGFWPPDLQIIGKDILRFHAIHFPAMLQGLGLPLPQKLLAHAHWTVKQKKMSKSVGNVADPFDAMERYGVDAVRYYLARVGGRFKDDVDWSDEQLDKYTNELRSLIGNFFSRLTSGIMMKHLDKPPLQTLADIYIGSTGEDPNRMVIARLMDLAQKFDFHLQHLDIAEALQSIVDVLKQANAAMSTIAPWSKDPSVAQASLITSLETLRICGLCLQPFVPSLAKKLLDALGVDVHERSLRFATLTEADLATQTYGRRNDLTPGVRLFEIPSARRQPNPKSSRCV